MPLLPFDELFAICHLCGGSGWFDGRSAGEGSPEARVLTSIICPECKGRGGAPTEQGDVLWQFIKYMQRGDAAIRTTPTLRAAEGW